MIQHSRSARILECNEQHIPGGVVSGARKVEPHIAFARGHGAYMWDVDDNRYIDYHAAFAPYVLGHNDPKVNAAVKKVLDDGISLFGSGTNELEGRLAELLCTYIPAVEKVEFSTTGSEASLAALRLARTITEREHVIVMQGGFNGSHSEIACNVLTPLEQIGPRVSPGEYPYIRLGAGLPRAPEQLVHVINFNDLASVRYVCEKHSVAALITEPILQNIGIVKPEDGYLEGLRTLADEFGFLLIFDEVKTGFRYCLGGYSELSGVKPDLAYYAKAIANGYPISVVGGKAEHMDRFDDPDASRRPLIGGTYNAHPVSVAAAIATIEALLEGNGAVYRHMDNLGAQIQEGIEYLLNHHGISGRVARQGGAFCLYLMHHLPRDYHDLAEHHDFERDLALRRSMIDAGVYFFPVATKQCSISAAHNSNDITATIEALERAFTEVF